RGHRSLHVRARIAALILVGIEHHGLTDLAQVTAALDAVGSLAGARERGEKNRDQQSDDPDNDEQFHERKALGLRLGTMQLHKEAPFRSVESRDRHHSARSDRYQ